MPGNANIPAANVSYCCRQEGKPPDPRSGHRASENDPCRAFTSIFKTLPFSNPQILCPWLSQKVALHREPMRVDMKITVTQLS